MKVLIVGLGLMGGSFAKAIKTKTGDIVAGWDMSDEVIKKALTCGAIDERAQKIPPDTDLILIALYPRAAVDFVRQNVGDIPSGCMLVDICGVKRSVCSEIEQIISGKDAVYIGGHPMAGREFSGFDASDAELFNGASMILTPPEGISKSHCLLAELFFLRLGFGGITYTTPEEHDEMIALTSQMAHIVSSAYVQNPASLRHAGFSAGSFRDMTRVAKLHEQMWTELFLCNTDFLSLQLDQLITKLNEFKKAIDEKDENTLCEMLRQGRIIKEQLNRAEK
ncbi:MAG: prephenate dehydrogenase [Christensenellales bacterium]|jgi:prephenate dehydrogenase